MAALAVDSRNKFAIAKFSSSLEFVFGLRVPYEELESYQYYYSRKTGRLRYVKNGEDVLFTLRANGSIAPTIAGARLLISQSLKKAQFVIRVLDGVAQEISKGKTVFCKHVAGASNGLRSGQDVVVVSQNGTLLAVGNAVLAGPLMKQFKRGVAVKIREGANKHGSVI